MLTEAYGPISITWQVEKVSNFDYAGEQHLMANSTGLSTYNDEMKALNEAYITSIGSAYDASANYLFFLKATGSETINERDITGFMPRGAQFGYLFTSEIKEAYVPAAVAHELGHGRWKLVHPFDANYGGLEEAKVTDNLMAYGNGLVLAKWQWDIVNDPAMLVSLFEGDEESENVIVNNLPTALLNATHTFNLITPTGKKITLPEVCTVIFSYGVKSTDEITYPVGYLHGFKIKNSAGDAIIYTASIEDGNFLGYFKGDERYVDTRTPTDENNGVILMVPEKEGIRYLKIETDVPAYSDDEAVLTYATFPVNPYLNPSLILKQSDLLAYAQVSGLTKNADEDWTLNKEYFAEALAEQNGKEAHAIIVKITELRTAYTTIFEQFTGCYEVWNAN